MITLNKDFQLGSLIQNKYGNEYLFSVNRNNFSEVDYQTLFHKEFNNTFENTDTLYLIIGTDSGLMVKHLLESPPEKGSAYVFIEFPEIIECTKQQYKDKLNQQKRVLVTTEDQWQIDSQKLGLDIYFILNKVQLIKSFAAQYYYLNDYLFLRQQLESRVNHLKWQHQTQIGSKTFIKRQLENLAENQTPAIVLKDYFKGKSALILAGGPSLDRYIKWIEDNQDNYLVIAVSRIARRLLDTKIKPDIFVSVDPNQDNFYVSKEVLNFHADSLLINQHHIYPQLLGNWLGKSLYLGNLFPWNASYNPKNLMGTGPTVTNTAILLAINLSIKEQILFGVDLCYSPEGYTHASESYEYEVGPKLNVTEQTIKTNNGEVAETNSAYFEAISGIQELAETSKKYGGKIINPSGISARIKHVEHIELDKIKIPEEKTSIKEIINKLVFHEKEENEKHYLCVLKELKQAQYKLQKIEKLAEKGLDYNKHLFSTDNPSENFNFKLKMDTLEKELNNKELGEFSDLSKKFGANRLLHFLKTDQDQDWSNEEIRKSGDTYYNALLYGSRSLIKSVYTAIINTEARLVEYEKIEVDNELLQRHLLCLKKTTHLDNKNDPEDIIKIRKDIYDQFINNEPALGKNRSERLKNITFYLLLHNNEMTGDLARISRLETYRKKFGIEPENILLSSNETLQDVIDNHKAIYKSFLMKKNDIDIKKEQKKNLEGLDIKIYQSFSLKNKKNLETIINNLKKINQEDDALNQAYYHLAMGYLYELKGQEEEAIEEYGLADHQKTIESALKRIAYITLNNNKLDYAHDALKLLSDISPLYLSQLAELYLHTKNYRDALDTYTHYLEYNPTDIPVLLKLSNLYEQHGLKEGKIFIDNEIKKIKQSQIVNS